MKEKNIVHIYGGLGNQMFQYTFFKYLQKTKKNTFINTDYFCSTKKKEKHSFKYLLSDIFQNIKDKPLSDSKSKTMYSDKLCWRLYRVFRKIIYQKKIVLETFNLIDIDNIANNNQKVKHFRDYWQDSIYANETSKEIKHSFSFDEAKLTNTNKKCLAKITDTQSVSIHVRRGDYLLLSDVYGNICTEKYYEKAIEIIKNNIENPHFYIFSNDIKWCKDFFKNLENTNFIDWNEGEESYWDMFLMSKCKHNIIANSSFSWWGAWLNTNINKKVILPKQWFANKNSDNLLFEGCKQI